MEPEPEPQVEAQTAVQQAQEARQQRLANLSVPPTELRDMPFDALQLIAGQMRPRDAARIGGVSRTFRDVSRVALHNLDRNPHLTRLQERYRSRLKRPHIQTPYERIPLSESMREDRDVDFFARGGHENPQDRPSLFRKQVIDRSNPDYVNVPPDDQFILTDQLGRPLLPSARSRGR